MKRRQINFKSIFETQEKLFLNPFQTFNCLQTSFSRLALTSFILIWEPFSKYAACLKQGTVFRLWPRAAHCVYCRKWRKRRKSIANQSHGSTGPHLLAMMNVCRSRVGKRKQEEEEEEEDSLPTHTGTLVPLASTAPLLGSLLFWAAITTQKERRELLLLLRSRLHPSVCCCCWKHCYSVLALSVFLFW